MSCKLKSSLPRRYLKKDTKKKLSRLRDVLQRILSWLKEKLPKKQTAVSATEVAPEQAVNEEGGSLGVSSPILLQHAEQLEVKVGLKVCNSWCYCQVADCPAMSFVFVC